MIKQIKDQSILMGDFGEVIKISDFLSILGEFLNTGQVSFVIPELNADFISTQDAITLIISTAKELQAISSEHKAAKHLEMMSISGRE